MAMDGWCWSPVDQNTREESTSSRLIRVSQTDLTWKEEPALSFIQSGFALRVHYDLPTAILPTSQPDLILSSTSEELSEAQNTSKSVTQLYWKLTERATKICLPSAAALYNLDATSSCVQLDQPSLTQILPGRDCAPILARSPLVRVGVARVPVLIQLTYQHPYVSTDRTVLTKNPIRVDVTQPADSSNAGRTEKISAHWSNSQPTDSPPVAQAVAWIDVYQSVHIKPHAAKAIPGRWFYTYLIRTDPVTLNASVPAESVVEPPTPQLFTFVHSTTSPPAATATAPKTPTDFTRCSSLFHTDLTVQFTLDLGVTLFGETHPIVQKAEVKLFAKSTRLPGDSSIPLTTEPLLPIHPTGTSSTGSRVQSAEVDVNQTTGAGGVNSEPPRPIEIVITDLDGTFLFGPVPIPPQLVSDQSGSPPALYRLPTDPTEWFTVELSKPGYEFTALKRVPSGSSSPTASNWRFKATKLSLVEVVVRHADERATSDRASEIPLQGVLVSIIGEGHRGNEFTDKSGLAHFVGLAPGQYYLRPMMKEYFFTVIKPKAEQAGHASPITVSEGVTVRVEVMAKRVAFSLSGLVSWS
ncbi:unnamed protein product [Echinostoma caproni]|uniref:Uncharacterized protein n=1 Tax=Echinostoma caproni TaxID=27848 RepID=A0A3P8L5N6_9TREM|nr:unnamed protein product [Echinostoma caproni]